MSVMRKKNGLFAVAIVLIVATLSGCSKLDSSFREQIVLKSGVREDANYKTYEQNKENLDDSGYIKEDPLVQQPAEDGIHVTFAKNNRIQATFFLDVSLDTPLNSSGCYIKPGDTVFATVEESDNSFYVFSGFKVYEIDAAGNRKLSKALKMSQSEGSKYELSIPDDYTGSEIAIEPVGEYKPSELVLYDFYLDNNGNKVNLNGTWKVNGKGYTSDVVTISPVSSYIVSYKYDSNEYFYVNSAPDSFYIDNDDGEITFRQINADDKKEPVYSVELQKYFSIRVVSDRERRVSVDDGPFQTIGANTELSLDHLKYGDIITILTDAPWPALDNRNDLILINSPEPLSKGEIKYTLSVPERSGTFTFNPNDYSYEHGAIVFEVNGKTVSTPQKLPKGKKIFYRQQYADPGYWLGDGEHFIVVGDETNTIRSLQEIHFIRKEGVTVFLPQPAVGGTIKYKINGRQIDNHTISTYSGTIISMTFNKWEGWQSNIAEDSVNYVVTTEGTQTANANGAPIDELFREDVEHMPALTAILEKSVGENMEVAISADGFLIESVKYGDGSSFLDWNSWNISSPSDSAPNT